MAKKWGIKGNRWYKEDWNYEEENINELRKQIVNPILKLKNNLNTKKTAKEISYEIYKFLEENNFYEKLNTKIALLEEENELKLASDYKSSIENLVEVLDEIVILFENENITFEKYKELLKIGLKNRELGSIPQTIDEVILGDVDRSRTHKVKAEFILGINDGVFPSINKNEGFFNDKDREKLKELGAEMAKGTTEMLYDEEFNIYKAMTIAEEKLFLSYTSSDEEGKALRSSVLITKIKKIFPNLVEKSDVIKKITDIATQESTFDELLYNIRNYKTGKEIDTIWFDVYNWYYNNNAWHNKLLKALEGLEYTNKGEHIDDKNIKKSYGVKYEKKS